jgi:hypothetical protein
MKRVFAWCAVAAICGISATAAQAGVTVSTFPDAATWPDVPTLQTTALPQTLTVNQQITGGGNTLTQTIVTGPEGFRLGHLDIYSGGKGGGTARLNIYPEFIAGGTNTDGFVNTSFSTDLLNGGAGLEFAFNGSGGNQFVRLDLTGDDQIVLAPNSQYAIEIDLLSGQFSWLRSAGPGTYADGNIYQGGTEAGFNGTAPANNRGQRNQVGGTPDRDGGLALYAIPEPTSVLLAAVGMLGLGLVRVRIS